MKKRKSRAPAVRDLQWLLSLLPAFPLLLLVLRLWYLSRQDLETMLLLVQYVSPLGLLSALLITLVWVPPLVILVIRMLGALLWLSLPDPVDVSDSWLVRLSERMPDWVVALAVLQAVLTWQLRFLPTLLLLTVVIVALVARGRRPDRRWWVRGTSVVLPLVVTAVAYAWVLPAGAAAVRSGEAVTAVLLLAPQPVAVLLTGPVPARAARVVTHWTAMVLGLLAPFVFGAIFLNAPVLPTVALELGADPAAGRPVPAVLRAHVLTTDDRVTTLLDTGGRVVFVPNEGIVSRTLCPGQERGPASAVEVHGWHVEQTMLEWLAPPPPPPSADPRCQGRPLRTR